MKRRWNLSFNRKKLPRDLKSKLTIRNSISHNYCAFNDATNHPRKTVYSPPWQNMNFNHHFIWYLVEKQLIINPI